MADLNCVLLEGHLTKDPKERWRDDGDPMSTLFIENAGNESRHTYEVHASGKVAMICNNNLKKGCLVKITGRLNVMADHRVVIIAELLEWGER